MEHIYQLEAVELAIAASIDRQVAHQVVTEDALQVPGARGIQSLVGEGRSAGDDTVEVTGIALGFHQALTASLRATFEVGISRCLAVVLIYQYLACHDSQMNGAVAEIDLSLAIVEGK